MNESKNNSFDIQNEYFEKFKNSHTESSTFSLVQRLIWEKALFPNRFPKGSIFLCSSCSCKSLDLSFCLQCGRIFCGKHFVDHLCPPGFGVDISTRQLFVYEPEFGRRFIFNCILDLMTISAKLSLVDGIPADAMNKTLEQTGKSIESVLPVSRPPMALQNLGNTCWLNSLLQCFVVNPLLEKWFLSGVINVTEVNCPEAAIHNHLARLFLAQKNNTFFSLSQILFAIWTLFPNYASPVQFDCHEFLMDLRDKLNTYYQHKFDSDEFSSIFSWSFKVIESCENCEETRTFITTSSDLILNSKSSSLAAAFSEFLKADSPCSNCQKLCKCEQFFNTLPPTLVIQLGRTRGTEKGLTVIPPLEELSLNDYIDLDKKNELGDAKYSLSGVVVRPGSGETGHYWADVKKAGQWYRCDDSNVKPIELSEVLRDDASLLFYIRKGFVA